MASTEITPESAIYMYLQNYVDLTENFPNDIARLISEIHVIDVKISKFSRLLEFYRNKYIEKAKNWNEDEKVKHLEKLETTLLALERESDIKLEVLQSISEQIELKHRQLEASYRLASTLTQNQPNQSNGSASNYSNSTNKNSGFNASRHENNSNGRNSPAFHKDRDNNPSSNGKRMRRGSNKNNNHDSNNGSGDDRASTPVTNDRFKRGTNKRGLKSNKTVEKRGKTYSKDDSQENGDSYDPNEPTYCLCEQVSYGVMICCDNQQCSISWFHLSCVSLKDPPKGRWFCPNCRGERSNVQRK